MNNSSKHLAKIRQVGWLPMVTLTALVAGHSSVSEAGATFKIDDTKWISLGLGMRTSFSAAEDKAGNTGGDPKWSTDFTLNNLRLYTNGQIHKYIKFTFNTECPGCNGHDKADIQVLDGIVQFEFNPYTNIWAGRQLVPEGRLEMNGPFYSATYEPFKAPFEPSDASIQGVIPGMDAGTYGRDEGVNYWGAALDGHLKYVFGAFQGLKHNKTGANADGNLLYGTRIAYNILNAEKAPGYYSGGTAYGGDGDVLTFAGFAQYQEDGAGTAANAGNFLLAGGDVKFEKVLPNNGVLTINTEYKNFGIDYHHGSPGANDPTTFYVGGGGGGLTNGFQGDSVTGNLLYLIPQKVWVGQFQPYIMYTQVNTRQGYSVGGVNVKQDQSEYEAGMNYIIDGHNARVSLLWQGGDLSGGGAIYNPNANGTFVNAIKLGVQVQI
ncbi:hypothetical protein [Methylovulum psychrotolerans]|jgi:hypothetical protein|uniref:Porin n=1 Tax=Methylovulum psychrotolerans TaxID=1704499 RepID=A0A1Z4BWI7_9GAMM|nr:hypothetical protein [Methylovulum psychrotolerans]ASF45677.1 hypothetical protein CEK71_06095 [Methylovulum psychrotolerans]MBT9098198.1 hypothetical protein [Methylovulum psychrotolerans]POZ53910.1 hypothetical protein AADEFJLK_00952 [Methylovulum psychrotolerans]